MSDDLETVKQDITQTKEEIDHIKGLPTDNPERAAFAPLYGYLTELQKKENILLERAQPDKVNIRTRIVQAFCDSTGVEWPSEPAKLSSALLEPFHVKIPIETEVHKQWKSEAGVIVDDYFVDADVEHSTAGTFGARCIAAIPEKLGGSENRLISKYDNIIANMWEILKATQPIAIDIDRNVSDAPGLTVESMRPDVLVWVRDTLIFKGEEKKDGIFDVVKNELREKMQDWNIATSGNLPYLLSYGAVREKIQFFAITKNASLVEISPRYDVSNFSGAFNVLISALNMFKFFLTAATLLPDEGFPLMKILKRSNGTPISFISSTYVQKRIDRFDEYPYSSFDVLQRVYETVRLCEYAARAYQGPELLEKKRDKRKLVSYVVHIEPVCFRQQPHDVRELKIALYHIFQVLVIIHNTGFVHRDLRWENIWKDSKGRYIVGDWEHAGRINEIPTFVLNWWAPELHTLPTPPYTDKADIFLVGSLLDTMSLLLSAEKLRLRSQLKFDNPDERPSAAVVLKHQWFDDIRDGF
ncbi:12497_t:CDS:2 [Funneliformis mosseae]|uniref:12497_t:CDS:1 n=1 Tax=Funneliformis mosseae TaxID=27381 RepID=A0A9N9F9R5_FUNMO|nr:12497_t:CDS:2 [Funneliformis mosseae]